ncbi:unnamed protein product, partial [Owenia fusiformis]
SQMMQNIQYACRSKCDCCSMKLENLWWLKGGNPRRKLVRGMLLLQMQSPSVLHLGISVVLIWIIYENRSVPFAEVAEHDNIAAQRVKRDCSSEWLTLATEFERNYCATSVLLWDPYYEKPI